MSQPVHVNVPDKMSIPQILRLHQAGGVLHSEPAFPTKDLLVDTPEAQLLASLWDDFNKAKKALEAKIAELSATV
jgi:hypothetical protein